MQRPEGSDAKKAESILPKSSLAKRGFAMILLSFVIALSFILAIVCFSSSLKIGNGNKRRTEFVYLQQRFKGKQPIQDGCVNLYGADWHQFKDTDVVVICKDADFHVEDLNKYALSDSSASKGLSYVETGAGVYVTLHSSDDLTGQSHVIHPEQSVSLSDVSWNDVAKSIMISKRSEIMYIVEGLQNPVPSPHCAILYASNPIREPNSMGFVTCGNFADRFTEFPPALIESHGFDLKTFGEGISYVVTGSSCSISLYDSADLKHARMIFIKAGSAVDLSKLYLSNKGKVSWDNQPITFKLVYK